MGSFRAIIPAAGVGTRMRPLTHTRPKVLLPLAGRAIIGHLIADLMEIGIRDITVVVGYFGEKVEEYCREEFPEVNFRFKWQERRLGLGHAVGTAIEEDDEELLVVYGDTLFRGDISDIRGDAAALGLVEVEDPRRFGIAVVEDGRITYLEEKPDEPRSNLALAGVNYFPDARRLKEAIDRLVDEDIKTKGEYQITDAMHLMLKDGQPFRPLMLDAWYDAGMPSTLIETNRILLDTKPGTGSVPDAARRDNVVIDPVYIDPRAEVSESVIGPYVHIGARARVRNSILRDTIVDNDTEVSFGNLESAALGQHVRYVQTPDSPRLGDHSSSDGGV